MDPLHIVLALVIITNAIHCTVVDNKKVNLPVLNKCCSTDEHVGTNPISKKVCMDNNSSAISLDFSQIPLFDYDVGTTIYDIFDIVPGKFYNDEMFHESSMNTLALRELNVYLTENGFLYLEMPNAYDRWRKLDPNMFCVDFYRNKLNKVQPSFWIFQPDNKNQREDKNDDFLTIAMFVSSFFLLMVLIVYALLPELRNLCGMILMAYVASLLVALLLLGVIRMKKHADYICLRLTLVIYYSFLASFCWMTVMSYDIWWTFRGYAKARPIHRRGEPFKYLMYSIYAWGLPLAMTVMLACINNMNLRDKPWFVKPNLPSGGCFIENGEKFLYLYIPMLILICFNWLFYLMTAFNIWRLSRGTAVLDSAAAGTPAAHRNHRHRFLVYLKLTIVMGLNWILEVVSFLVPGFRLWYLTDVYNILIGVSIFLIFVCKRTILRKLTKQCIRYSETKWYPAGNSTRSNTTSSESSQETQTLQVCVNPKGPGYVINNF